MLILVSINPKSCFCVDSNIWENIGSLRRRYLEKLKNQTESLGIKSNGVELSQTEMRWGRGELRWKVVMVMVPLVLNLFWTTWRLDHQALSFVSFSMPLHLLLSYQFHVFIHLGDYLRQILMSRRESLSATYKERGAGRCIRFRFRFETLQRNGSEVTYTHI